MRPSSNSNIAKRPGLMFACVNLGVPATLTWEYFQTGLSLWIVVPSGLIALVALNALLVIMYRRAKAAKQD
jgi:hypothetical protein